MKKTRFVFIALYLIFQAISAVAYAHMWAYDRNPKYAMRKFPVNIIPSADCANFVSQSLNRDGIKTRDDWFNEQGQFSILGKRMDKNYSLNWTTAKGLTQWLRNQKNVYNGESIIRNGDNFNSDLTMALERSQIGDVIGWSTDNDAKNIHHVGIITKISDGNIYYTAHTNDRKDRLLENDKKSNDKSIVIIHILDEAY